MDPDQINAVKRMQGFIEAHLAEPVTLSALARAARYSPWHAARLFKEYTGRSPFDYIRQRRLSAAANRLSASPCKVVDVAFDFVFDSHEGFTRAFTRQFGMPPRRFQRQKPSVVSPPRPPRQPDQPQARPPENAAPAHPSQEKIPARGTLQRERNLP